MAITKSAKKAHRASLKKRVYNLRRKEASHDAIKAVRKAIESKKLEDAEKLIPAAYKAIDKAAKRGAISKHSASRKKAGLIAALRRASK